VVCVANAGTHAAAADALDDVDGTDDAKADAQADAA
jgi:hypothetical protein